MYKYMGDIDFTNFVSTNSGFILTFFGICGGCVSGLAMCFLKSRCVRIKCCCISCDRTPLSEAAINDVALTPIPHRVNNV